jgi:hypothetical protein
VVEVIRSEADGDLHVRVQLDPPYVDLLTSANANQAGCSPGCLVVEPICVHAVTQPDALASCQADPDPLQTLPVVGQHLWFEGRLVHDLDHGGWTELHPLYGFGPD